MSFLEDCGVSVKNVGERRRFSKVPQIKSEANFSVCFCATCLDFVVSSSRLITESLSPSQRMGHASKCFQFPRGERKKVGKYRNKSYFY